MSTASLKSQPEGEVGPEQFLLIGKTMPSHFGSQMYWMFAARWPRDPQETPQSMSTILLTGQGSTVWALGGLKQEEDVAFFSLLHHISKGCKEQQ